MYYRLRLGLLLCMLAFFGVGALAQPAELLNRKVTLRVDGEPLRDVLERLFTQQKLSFDLRFKPTGKMYCNFENVALAKVLDVMIRNAPESRLVWRYERNTFIVEPAPPPVVVPRRDLGKVIGVRFELEVSVTVNGKTTSGELEIYGQAPPGMPVALVGVLKMKGGAGEPSIERAEFTFDVDITNEPNRMFKVIGRHTSRFRIKSQDGKIFEGDGGSGAFGETRAAGPSNGWSKSGSKIGEASIMVVRKTAVSLHDSSHLIKGPQVSFD